MIENIYWLGHASFKIVEKGKVIYIDPWKIKKPEEADIILVTHSHYDHFSPEDIKVLQGDRTIIVSTRNVIKQCSGNKKELLPGQKINIEDVGIEGVVSYNINKKFHPKEDNNLGFIITIDKIKIYHAGDTDFIPEMKELKVDIALLPVSGTYVMNPSEAVDAGKTMKPKIAIPMHYGSIVGSIKDAEDLKKGLEGIVKVVIKDVEE
jgi:L-ascorbate metabolism protein UlaG (beta-lactamase superfamily)